MYDDISAPTYYAGQSTGKWLTYLDEYAQGLHPEGVVLDGGTPYNLAPTDVYKDMMDKFGFQQQHNLSISGGGSKASYRISFGMVNNDGILITDKDTYSRYNVSSFVSLDATRWLTGQLDIRYSDSKTSTAMTNAENNNQAIWAFASNYQPMGPLGYGHPNSGERINPTGKKLFKEALLRHDMDYILGQALEQISGGVHVFRLSGSGAFHGACVGDIGSAEFPDGSAESVLPVDAARRNCHRLWKRDR